ncbi:hypothetical protein SAR11G3_00323 [Candidatus Pelagibacter sp. IMCC9063]|nr:hypothetical protein SAR11G3_00323 [Candidatus Pelagibacter sp. IMCC9063]
MRENYFFYLIKKILAVLSPSYTTTIFKKYGKHLSTTRQQRP